MSDDGPGVAKRSADRIFELGVSTKTAIDEHQGRGIGLALVARIVARRGGTIAVDDQPGGGAVFGVQLPSSAFAGSSSAPGPTTWERDGPRTGDPGSGRR